MRRITAYLLRFVSNEKSNSSLRRKGCLTTAELINAERVLIHQVQSHTFSEELKALSSGRPVSTNSKLKSLHLFLSQGLIQVGGRLQHASKPEFQRHPILLPARYKLTDAILEHTHLKLLHIRPLGLLANTHLRYWPQNGRRSARRIVHKCITCFKAKPTSRQPFMGDLPAAWVNQMRPFARCGVDFAGPIFLRNGSHKVVLTKTYIAVFICFSVKAIRLELVSSLSADAFLAALRRFMARRGTCFDIYSDNGTNFVGAHRELRALYGKSSTRRTVQQILTDEEITWHFNPPGAPNFGGLWEAGVKSAKHHLVRCIKSAHLSFEELNTVVNQIEACLNSRHLYQ
ncbi:uncharacterized protein LOC126897920 [Daktulosphaira vitifoliae]|uniref:uncharacterized protein LOC126897920 n=1 Tax=Daktulosphaira vitifoliae TaxID=58002 RepID=UPI0021A99730|nr:uncharacterized protein LOC126897920 [Daktulosphaira vitifoliae]